MPGLITWSTDVPASSQIEYGLTSAYGNRTPLDASRVTSHSVQIPSIAPGNTYHYRIHSRNSAGTELVSTDQSFTIPYNLTTKTITWSTDITGSSLVEYGPTTAYGLLSVYDSTRVTSHSVQLLNLTSGTLYHYRVHSRNVAGTERISADATFTQTLVTATASIAASTTISVTAIVSGAIAPAVLSAHTALSAGGAAGLYAPAVDLSDGLWTTDTGGTTNLYTRINELVPVDATYIQSSLGPSNDTYTFGFNQVATPVSPSTTRAFIHVRYSKDVTGDTDNLSIDLLQSGSVIQSWMLTDIATGWVQSDLAILPLPTDWSNLTVRLRANSLSLGLTATASVVMVPNVTATASFNALASVATSSGSLSQISLEYLVL